MIFKTKSAGETQKIAASLAQKIINSKPLKRAYILALEGELGAGKTTFVQGFAKALKIKQRITSPTFVLIRSYKLRTANPDARPGSRLQRQGYKFLYHIDAFRLRDWRDLAHLGIKEIFAGPENIVLIEWAERVRPILQKKCINIHIDHFGENTRKITITSPNGLSQ